jgi:hypothetical protein
MQHLQAHFRQIKHLQALFHLSTSPLLSSAAFNTYIYTAFVIKSVHPILIGHINLTHIRELAFTYVTEHIHVVWPGFRSRLGEYSHGVEVCNGKAGMAWRVARPHPHIRNHQM